MGSDIHAFPVDPLPLELRHPCPTLLSFARMEVGIEHSQVGAVAIEHLVGLDVGMIDGYVLILDESDAIEPVSQSEDTFDDTRQFEVGSEHLCIEGILLEFQLVGVVSLVPRFQGFLVGGEMMFLLSFLCLPSREVLLEDILQRRTLFLGRRFVGKDERIEQSVDAAHLRCHAVFHHIVGESAEP